MIDNNYKYVKSQTSNIDINFNVPGMEIIYNKIANENNYIQFFDNKFSTGPSLKYQKKCEIPDSSPVFAIVNFKIKGSQEKQQMSLYYMSYEGYEGERAGSVSRKCVITNKEKYISLKFDIVPKSKVFKLAIKLGDDVNTNVIEFSATEIYH